MCQQQGASELFDETDTRPLACGRASMAFALGLLGVAFKNDELAQLASEAGVTSFADMLEFAHAKGLHAKAVRISPTELARLNNVAILQLERMSTTEAGKKHFVAFAGPAGENAVYIFDPIAAHGWRGKGRLDILAHKMTGNVLILSRYPINLSGIEVSPPYVPDAGILGHWPVILAVVGGAAVVIASLGILLIWRRDGHATA